jgi:hypothetical protein
MKPKHAFILLAAVAAVVVVIVIVEYGIKPRLAKKNETSDLLFPSLDLAQINEVDLVQGNTAAVLTRAGDSVWKVKTKNDYTADPESVKVLLDGIKALKSSSLASESKDNFERLGVTDTAPRISLKNGAQTLAELLVGNQGQNAGTFFVRKPEESKVHLVLDDVKNWTDGQMGEWRDKTIFQEDLANVDSLTFTLRTETVSAAPGATPMEKPLAGVKVYSIRHNRDNDKWEYVLSGDTVVALDSGKTEGLVRSLVELKAVEFADTVSPLKAELNPPGKEVAFKMKDGKSLGLYVGKSDGSKFYVRRSDLDLIEKVYRYQIDNIFKSKDALLAPAGPGEENPTNLLPPPQLPPPVIHSPEVPGEGPSKPTKPPGPTYPPPNDENPNDIAPPDNPEPPPPDDSGNVEPDNPSPDQGPTDADGNSIKEVEPPLDDEGNPIEPPPPKAKDRGDHGENGDQGNEEENKR